MRVETPGSLQQTLTAQNLVASCNAAVKVVFDIEEGRVAVGHFGRDGKEVVVDQLRFDRALDASKERDGASRPYAPVSEKAADDPHGDMLVVAAQDIRTQQINYDGVVVAGVKCNAVFSAGSDYAFDYVQRAVPVERSHLDPDHLLDFREAPPEIPR